MSIDFRIWHPGNAALCSQSAPDILGLKVEVLRRNGITMQIVRQKIEDILGSLRHLEVDWRDETAIQVIAKLQNLPVKAAYSMAEVEALLDAHFDEGILICRLFLGLSKDQFTARLHGARGSAGIGAKSYRADAAGFLSDLSRLGLLEAMAMEANRPPHWSDVLVERLRSGRGSAISGQRRGRDVEDFAEAIIKTVFGVQLLGALYL
jgi:hypothetical protein